ncbi:helix-turn-helix domain-containing protein [Marinivivus vitaminiproducens]|uniref:helix-turn-helix domain-containing protein n=1 Tax=Marinivivus vitaminiproducens TaxID=3035935 RepID=UPI003F9F912A
MASVHENARGLYRLGVIDKATMREFDVVCLTPVLEFGPEDIKVIREKAQASQGVFARYLNASPGVVSKWERGEKRPSGPALKLLTLAKEKGLDAIAYESERRAPVPDEAGRPKRGVRARRSSCREPLRGFGGEAGRSEVR